MPPKKLSLALAAGLLFLSGCATSGPGEADLLGGPQIRTVMAGEMGSGGEQVSTATLRYVDDPVLVEENLGGSLDDVWPLLLTAYGSEGLDPDGSDLTAGLLSVSRMEWSGDRGGEPVSTILDCGTSETGRPLADGARVVAAIASQLRAADEGSTRITTRFEGIAYPMGGATGGPRQCRTTGELERLIHAHVRAALEPGEAASRTLVPGNREAPGPTRPGMAGIPDVSSSPFRVAPEDLPIEPGDPIRVWVSPTIRLTGSYMGLRADTLLLRRSRRTALPLWAIENMQVKRTKPSATLVGSLVGAATGVVLFLSTDLGITGAHDIQGEILNPGLGALSGGLAGAAIGSIFFGSSWEDVSMEWAGSQGLPSRRE
jgi:hypothetical protein